MSACGCGAGCAAGACAGASAAGAVAAMTMFHDDEPRRLTKAEKQKRAASKKEAYEFNRKGDHSYLGYKIVAKVDDDFDVYYQAHKPKERYKPYDYSVPSVRDKISEYEAKGKWGKRWARFMGPW